MKVKLSHIKQKNEEKIPIKSQQSDAASIKLTVDNATFILMLCTHTITIYSRLCVYVRIGCVCVIVCLAIVLVMTDIRDIIVLWDRRLILVSNTPHM